MAVLTVSDISKKTVMEHHLPSSNVLVIVPAGGSGVFECLCFDYCLTISVWICGCNLCHIK